MAPLIPCHVPQRSPGGGYHVMIVSAENASEGHTEYTTKLMRGSSPQPVAAATKRYSEFRTLRRELLTATREKPGLREHLAVQTTPRFPMSGGSWFRVGARALGHCRL